MNETSSQPDLMNSIVFLEDGSTHISSADLDETGAKGGKGEYSTVPFVPREGRPVYCSDCFRSQQPARGSRRDDSPSYSYSGSSYDSGTSRQRSGDRRTSRW